MPDQAPGIRLCLLAGLWLGLATVPVSAQESQQPVVTTPDPAVIFPAAPASLPSALTVIAVVDVQLLLQKSAAAQSLQRQKESLRQQFAREQSVLEENLRQSEQNLGRLRATLPADQFDQKRTEFEQQVANLRRNWQERTRSLDTALNKAQGTMLDALMAVIAEVAGERKATLILPRHNVVFVGDPALDITDVVLVRLNQRLPQVSVGISG
jgi:outer membrane protein